MCGNNTIYFEYYSNYQTYQTYLLILIEDADDIVYKRNTCSFLSLAVFSDSTQIIFKKTIYFYI